MEKQTSLPKKSSHPTIRKVLGILGKILLVLLVTVALLVGALYCGLQVLIHGPSVTARDLFVRTV